MTELSRGSTFLPDAEATLAFGRDLAARLKPGDLVLLHGDLGAGKTTLVRGILAGLGHRGSVKSPTYTLLEPYELTSCMVLHFDFYRIGDSRELEFIGFDELMDADAIKLVEWPERAADRLPPADLEISLRVEDEGRRVEVEAAR
ncbi:MAG: tRNA (adenosine(37)-N6)-threonylcarbamoyltransferase complex ATPase subunit type 1 TsaE [Pseudomonadales bacterium]|nr:tRNA (adenosine(37)-N6)-threonylcarbamoyltransferase complex ATPase subunit type 1 TsaE [Pseudomonadales bacterium]NIX07114.1 tRNA (adenosine(37)-N6)-threonylcarbamoyltransferase complex ATPase subunit type 1 TsaE [Pseudomonadales bacterium]